MSRMHLTDLSGRFPGYHRPTEDESERLWNQGVLVIDASVLLGFYRYSVQTREAMFLVLEQFDSRMFVPHQAAEEFQRNRLSVIKQQVDVYDKIMTSVNSPRQRAQEIKRHPVLESKEILHHIDEFESNLGDYIRTRRSEHPELEEILSNSRVDTIRDRIQETLGKCIGPPYDGERSAKLMAEAQARFERKEPPGYLDEKKDKPERYGDVFFWMQTLDYAKVSRLPIIIVTDEEKEDWWWQFEGKIHGPRVELVDEMQTVAQQQMLMYKSDGLLEGAKRYLSVSISDEMISEVQEIAKEREAREAKGRLREVSEGVACPHCEWAHVAIRIGTEPGSSAMGHCPACEHLFHAHRLSSGDLQTTRGSLGQRIQISCPRCSERLSARFPEDGRHPQDRVCFNCLAIFDVYRTGEVKLKGITELVKSDYTDDRQLLCPQCDKGHAIFTRQGRWEYAICRAGSPYLLLRGNEVLGGPELSG